MKQIRNIFVLTSLLFAGCTAEETPGMENGHPSPDGVSAPLVIESASLNVVPTQTRASTQSEVRSGKIALFGEGGTVLINGNSSTSFNNEPYKWESGTWMPDAKEKTIYLLSPSISLCAYYPYLSTSTNKTAIPLTLQPYQDEKDLYYTPNQTISRGKGATLNLIPAYARLRIQFVSARTNQSFTVSKMQLKHLASSTTMNIAAGSYADKTVAEADGYADTKTLNVTATGDARDVWGDFLVPPCTPFGGKTKITIIVDGKEKSVELNYVPVAGEYKAITLRLQDNALVVVEISKKDWELKDGGSHILPA